MELNKMANENLLELAKERFTDEELKIIIGVE
jgi:hypothetical protein